MLGRRTDVYPGLSTILVYPRAYVAPVRKNDGGIITESISLRVGETWSRGRLVLAVLAVAGLVQLACPARVDLVERSEGRLGSIRIYSGPVPSGQLVFLFSDVGGRNEALAKNAEDLAREGATVVSVDLASYLHNLRESSDGCHYVIAEIEDLSHRLERERGFPSYRAPLLAGLGEGGTLAYAALAQAPWATLAGAVSVDATPTLATRVPLCAGAPAEADPAAGYRYGPFEALPGDWWVSPRASLPSALAALAQESSDDRAAGSRNDRLTKLVLSALSSGEKVASTLSDLPLTELPTSGPATQLAVVYSGDGGWRDLDKQIAAVLAREGTPVVGVDSLRYFWSEKKPDVVASDLERILRHYRERWGARRFLLIGYSFGAQILPFAVNRLPPELRAEVAQISLLAVGPLAPFQIAVTGWLGIPAAGLPVLPELRSLDLHRVQCIYGQDEKETLCAAPELDGAELIRTSGGHHFDGDFEKLAAEILEGAALRP